MIIGVIAYDKRDFDNFIRHLDKTNNTYYFINKVDDARGITFNEAKYTLKSIKLKDWHEINYTLKTRIK